MNIVLWILQVLLAVHTAIGAVWKFKNTEQAVPSLQVIPHGVWLSLSVTDLLGSAALLLPALYKQWGILAPIAATWIAAEMLLFSALHLRSNESDNSPVVYWMCVAAVCAVIAYGRFVLKPL